MKKKIILLSLLIFILYHLFFWIQSMFIPAQIEVWPPTYDRYWNHVIW